MNLYDTAWWSGDNLLKILTMNSNVIYCQVIPSKLRTFLSIDLSQFSTQKSWVSRRARYFDINEANKNILITIHVTLLGDLVTYLRFLLVPYSELLGKEREEHLSPLNISGKHCTAITSHPSEPTINNLLHPTHFLCNIFHTPQSKKRSFTELTQ